MTDTAASKTTRLPAHENTDYSVIEKASMSLGHAPSGLLLPGIDKNTEKEATRLCARDYLEHHVFFNNYRFHNHLNHHLLAVFSMGGSAKRLQEIFDGNRIIQRPTMPMHQVEINATNYTEYLAKEEHYPDYVAFFHKELDAAGDEWHAVVSKYISDPRIFPFFMSGAFHPFIQIGYGLEFESKAITATALAQACVHIPDVEESYFPAAFEEMRMNLDNGSADDVSLMQTLDMLRGERAAADIEYKESIFARENTILGSKLAAKYGKLWTVCADEKAISAKYEELLSTAALLYISTTRPGYKQVLDFFVLHCLTSAYFLPIILDVLSIEQKARTLHAHWIVTLSIYSLVGAPQLYITPEHTATNTHAVADGIYGGSANPWLGVFKDAINHNDIHVPKVIRALWRGSILSALQNKDSTEQKALPPVNWLYIARATLDTITMSSLISGSDDRNKGTRFWDKGMLGYDQFWENREKV
ncbi:hypothetical protein EV178_002318 [Coemansia sp. RSA 1646]|nr:hypothetical protein EV178_002318 [Coemansia sp. RSA 1646]